MPTKDEIVEFSLKIEDLVWEHDIPYMDAITLYCSKTGLEIDQAAKLVSGVIKSKLKSEAEKLHYLPKSQTRRLPL